MVSPSYAKPFSECKCLPLLVLLVTAALTYAGTYVKKALSPHLNIAGGVFY